MTPEYGIKLAVHLISTDFGDHAAVTLALYLHMHTRLLTVFLVAEKQWESGTGSSNFIFSYNFQIFLQILTMNSSILRLQKVCDCLLRKGTLALDDIVRTTKLSPQQVKTYLKVLIQHNCVQAFAMEHEGITVFFGFRVVVVEGFVMSFWLIGKLAVKCKCSFFVVSKCRVLIEQ